MNFLNIGPLELLFILLVALLLLGPEKLASTARRVGKTVARLRRATEDLPSLLDEIDPPPPPPAPPEGALPRPPRQAQEKAGSPLKE
ncbi:MAG: twin-arginine translocase TatA/TatE family subunit [Dehalococcoidia bacterium]|nr:twin-arginine translocase TatA/TatE family subunit [Dehalococcoidia bacterium]MDW8120458.1 twin-arginine translocase TatA/TatE family subunit [Chloroflexota bacterium]